MENQHLEAIRDAHRDLADKVQAFADRAADTGFDKSPIESFEWEAIEDSMTSLDLRIKEALSSPVDADAASLQPA